MLDAVKKHKKFIYNKLVNKRTFSVWVNSNFEISKDRQTKVLKDHQFLIKLSENFKSIKNDQDIFRLYQKTYKKYPNPRKDKYDSLKERWGLKIIQNSDNPIQTS